jgi:hypothetical protein
MACSRRCALALDLPFCLSHGLRGLRRRPRQHLALPLRGGRERRLRLCPRLPRLCDPDRRTHPDGGTDDRPPRQCGAADCHGNVAAESGRSSSGSGSAAWGCSPPTPSRSSTRWCRLGALVPVQGRGDGIRRRGCGGGGGAVQRRARRQRRHAPLDHRGPAITGVIIYSGVKDGIERAVSIMMPLMFASSWCSRASTSFSGGFRRGPGLAGHAGLLQGHLRHGAGGGGAGVFLHRRRHGRHDDLRLLPAAGLLHHPVRAVYRARRYGGGDARRPGDLSRRVHLRPRPRVPVRV